MFNFDEALFINFFFFFLAVVQTRCQLNDLLYPATCSLSTSTFHLSNIELLLLSFRSGFIRTMQILLIGGSYTYSEYILILVQPLFLQVLTSVLYLY